MNILVNASNLKEGGGLQVANSICISLRDFPEHHFTVVLSSFLAKTAVLLERDTNVKVFMYDIHDTVKTLVFGRDSFLDGLVIKNKIDCVLSIFGPSRWNPRCSHVCGFARAQLICPESPYYQRMTFIERMKSWFSNSLIRYLFLRSARFFYSENAWVSLRVQESFPNVTCKTITNYYNQIFDSPNDWLDFPLPVFNGTTILNIGSSYPHKHLGIAVEIARIFKIQKPDFRFRFVFTLTMKEFEVPEDVKEHFLLVGRVDISQCPSLYLQSDIMFQPSLLECFTATYPEAMRMDVPIVTTDLEFAHSLCKDAAFYYPALDAQSAAEGIFAIATCEDIRDRLVLAGREQLQEFDDYKVRAQKLVAYCKSILS